MIFQNVKCYDFSNLNIKNINDYKYSPNGIVLKLRLKRLPSANEKLIDIPGLCSVSYKNLNINELDPFDCGEGYTPFADENGMVPAVITEFHFTSEHEDWNTLHLGIPTSLCDPVKDDLYIVVDKTHFRLVYGGKVVNYNLIYGKLSEPENSSIFCNYNYAESIGYSNDINSAKLFTEKRRLNKPLNYYTPFGHNTFIGDIVNFYHDGIYHMLYMPDTHHHQNRWSCGGHHFEHMITKDFITWEDVGAVTDIEEQWQSVGTGTLFYHGGKYYSVYGLHTDRMIEKDRLYPPVGCKKSEIIPFEDIFKSGKYPFGATYAESIDGIHFTPGNKICAPVTNPSVYEENGSLVMYSGDNIWESEGIDKPWKIIKSGFPPCGHGTKMLNTGECPSFFEWNGYKYLIMGVTGFWRTEKDSDEYIDYAAKGYDIYEGLSVPMAVKTDDGRVIMAGWLGGAGWGSCVVHRELVQLEGGNLGTKWLPELFPKTEYLCDIEGLTAEITPKTSYYLDIRLERNGSDFFAVRFSDGESEVELKLNFKDHSAQYSTAENTNICEDIPPLYKAVKDIKDDENFRSFGFSLPGKTPAKCGDFSIPHVDFGGNEISIKIILYFSEKINSTIADAEINQNRTIISNRVGFFPKRIKFLPGKSKIIGASLCKVND